MRLQRRGMLGWCGPARFVVPLQKWEAEQRNGWPLWSLGPCWRSETRGVYETVWNMTTAVFSSVSLAPSPSGLTLVLHLLPLYLALYLHPILYLHISLLVCYSQTWMAHTAKHYGATGWPLCSECLPGLPAALTSISTQAALSRPSLCSKYTHCMIPVLSSSHNAPMLILPIIFADGGLTDITSHYDLVALLPIF